MNSADGVRTLRVTIPDDLVDAVAARAKSEGVTTSEYVIRVLSKELARPTSVDGLRGIRTVGKP